MTELIFPDPLRIHYLLLLGDDTLEDASPFQGFGPSWSQLPWAMDLLAQLPADVLERTEAKDVITAQRMGGMRQLLWSPLSISALERLDGAVLGMFVVLLSGDAEVSRRAGSWVSAQKVPILHVSIDGDGDAVPAGEFSQDVLQTYCRTVFEQRAGELSAARNEAVRTSLEGWKPRETETIDLKAWAHNIAHPNHIVLARAGYEAHEPASFHGKSEVEYTEVIAGGIRAVESIRDKAGYREFLRLSLIHPALFLVEPAFYRHSYARVGPAARLDRAAAATLRLMQAQRGLYVEVSDELGKQLQDSPVSQQLVAIRQSDLNIFTAAVGLKAAQTCSAVMRLSPAVNHVFPRLGNYARHIRSGNAAARLKAPRLFRQLQDELVSALGQDRLALIDEVGGPIKIVSDAPIEWVPIAGLPLMFRYQCSRICATPGNLLLGQLAKSEPITVTPEAIRRILVVSSFEDNDPLRNLLVGAINSIKERWAGKVAIEFRRVSSREEFIAALNGSDASILIFDGHGDGNSDTGIATLRIGKENVDVWKIGDDARVPPIVILSACDTQGVDARSHATVGNGFLAIGAQTVLATMLPVGGEASASLIARLIYRLADYVPAVISSGRVLNWTEVISGMQQMLLASEILNTLVGPITEMGSPRAKLQTKANIDINSGNPDWYELLIDAVAEHRGNTREAINDRAAAIIARSEAIRYIQLGAPENILIDDGSVADTFFPAGFREAIGA